LVAHAFTVLMGALAIPAVAGEPASFDYLYIVANEGGSSGGHSAIRFGHEIYHFQSVDGLLVLQRDRADEFLYTYALLGNRTIHSTRVAVSEDTLSGIIDRFRRRHRAQEAQLGVRDALRDDSALLERLMKHAEGRANGTGVPRFRVPGLGYFAREDSHSPDLSRERSTTLIALRATIEADHGEAFLAERRRTLYRELNTLAAEEPRSWTVVPPSTAYDHPPFARPYSSRWGDLVAGLAALEVLENAPLLAIESRHAPSENAFILSPTELRAFEAFAEKLSRRLTKLAASRRLDWGHTFLIGAARLAAIEESVRTGRLVFLDSFPQSARRLAFDDYGRRHETAQLMVEENRAQMDASREYFTQIETASELAWERVEERSNRYFEISKGLRTRGPIRVASGHLVPSRDASYSVPISLEAIAALRSSEQTSVRRRERNYSRELTRLHRYGLVSQNCATALFETVNDAVGDSKAISRQELGGYVSSRRSLAFIPFVASQQVADRYSVIAKETIPSYRRSRLETMFERESVLRVALRESNTFTSTTYERNPDDSFFIFFTDRTILWRPLLGAVNLTAALGQTLLGVLTSPFDEGTQLGSGMRGAFVSLPELAFANIRKGSNDWIPQAHRHVDPVLLASDSKR
jgi:hypothetical protein